MERRRRRASRASSPPDPLRAWITALVSTRVSVSTNLVSTSEMARMLSLFFGLGVLPLLVLGGVSYRQSMDSVEELLATETTFIAQRIARELENRYARYQSDLTLLAENDVWFIPVDPMLGPAPVTESEGQINSFVLSPGGQRIAYSP